METISAKNGFMKTVKLYDNMIMSKIEIKCMKIVQELKVLD